MSLDQPAFRNALLDATLPVPESLRNVSGGSAGARFNVYRNNVVVSLSEALSTAFPLVRKLLGAETFTRLAGVFVREHPPSSPLMMFYGDQLPAFLETFEPLGHIGYLPDCARLDLALRQSYHAADAAPLDTHVFAAGADALSRRFALAPASRILRSRWPLHDIWRFNTEADAPKPQAVAQDVLITRPEFDPHPHLLPPGGAEWLALLAQGVALGDAAERVLESEPAFDLTRNLTLALSTEALAEFKTKETR